MHCKPVVELFIAAEPSKDTFRTESNVVARRAWERLAGDLDEGAEIESAIAEVAAGASVVIFGCGAAIPPSLPPCVVMDFDGELLATALADVRPTGCRFIGSRTPLGTGSADAVIITSRLSGLRDRWGTLVLTKARRIGRQVRVRAF